MRKQLQFEPDEVVLPRRSKVRHFKSRISGGVKNFKSSFSRYSVVFSSSYVIITLNSTLLFLLSYFIIIFFSQFVTAFAASWFNIHTIIHFNTIDFLITSRQWKKRSEFGVYGIGPVLVCIIAILCYMRYTKNWKYSRYQRMFFLWVMYQAVTYILGGLFFGSFIYGRCAAAIGFVFPNRLYLWALGLLTAGAMIFLGSRYYKMFLSSSKMYFTDFNKAIHRPYLVNQVIFPFILGNIVIILLSLPDFSALETGVNLSMLLLLIPLWIRANNYPSEHYGKNPREVSIEWGWLFWGTLTMVILGIILKLNIAL
ncbi:MAG: hypothetical protein NTX61_05320 [Bacteroidetes bacterium]|nr:hypothetical protein [Bacteroidota bacterium]